MTITLAELEKLRPNGRWAELPLFDRQSWTHVRFGDLVENLNETDSNPLEAGVERFIGLEHLEPGSLHVRAWGNVADGTTFTRRCRPGHVLFGKRRAYQRKVAVAEFDAVVSGDIYVLTAKDKRLLPELLPYVCLSERFFQHAVGTSAGSLSPRTNWASLASFEFDLPPLEQQRKIADALREVDEVQSSYRELQGNCWQYLLALLDQQLAPLSESSRALSNVFTVKHGWAFKGEFFNDEGEGPILLTPGNFGLRGELYFSPKNTKYYSGPYSKDYVLSTGDLVVVMTDLTPGAQLLGMPAVLGDGHLLLHNQRIGKMEFDPRELEPRFAYYLLLSDTVRCQIRRTASGSTVRHTSPNRILEAAAHIPARSEQAALSERFDGVWRAYKSCVGTTTAATAFATSLREEMFSC